MKKLLKKHWDRLKRSLGRRYREWRLPRSYMRLGTRYGGWWIDRHAISATPLLVDAGLGVDISFPTAFLAQFGGQVIGIDPNPHSIRYCEANQPGGMTILQRAFWHQAGQHMTFHMPRPPEQLPKGADGVSGSLLRSHNYTGDDMVDVETTSFDQVLHDAGRNECDILKLDIEGAEYEVLSDLCRSGTIRKARQVMIEFHHHCTSHPLSDTLNAAAAIEANGFKLIHTENRNYIFRRSDLG